MNVELGYARLKLAFVDGLVRRLQMPSFFPDVISRPHDTRDDWIEMKAQVNIATSIASSFSEHAVQVLIADAMARDLGELLVKGCKASKDPYLAIIDGLEVLQTWPAAFVLSDYVTIETDTQGEVLTVVTTIRLRVESDAPRIRAPEVGA